VPWVVIVISSAAQVLHTKWMPQQPIVLDLVQLKRIESVHRGFLYQHLFAVGCLLCASTAQASTIIVEADEDIEIILQKSRIYVQVKTRSKPLIYADISGAMERFTDLREKHEKGARMGSRGFVIVANVPPAQELSQRLQANEWPSDVELCWPGSASTAAVFPAICADIPSAFNKCCELAAALPFGMLAPETLVWKLAGIVMAAAAGVPPRHDHEFRVGELPALFEQLAIQLHDFPAPPPVYRPQIGEPDLATNVTIRLITGFSGAGKTAWVSQAAQHSNSELAYFDVGDLPGPAIAIPLARELAGRYFGSGGGLGQILLPGATGLEMLRALALQLRSQKLQPTVVIDNAHRVPSDSLREIVQQTPGLHYIFLCQPGPVVQELEAVLSLRSEFLQGWTTDTIAAEAADVQCTTTPASAQRLLNLTAGLPLYVQNATRLAASEYAGNLAQFCDELERQTHNVTTAQELILSKVFNSLSSQGRDAVAILSMSDIALERGEAAALLKNSLGIDEATFARLVRELRPAGVIEVFGGDRLKIHDAIRVLGRSYLSGLDKSVRQTARMALKDVLLASIRRERNLAKLSLYLRILGEVGDIRTLVQFATDELFHELGVIQEIDDILETAAASTATAPEQRFLALDGLVFADLKNHRVPQATEHLRVMSQLVADYSLDESDRLTLAMKEMNLAALQKDETGVLATIGQIASLLPDNPQHQRMFRYNAAHALFSLGSYEGCISETSSLIEEYHSLLGLELKDVLKRNPNEIFPLLKKGQDHTDDLKHLADTLDLQATALSAMGQGSGLARIHAVKFYSMANALDSVVRVGVQGSGEGKIPVAFTHLKDVRLGGAKLPDLVVPVLPLPRFLTDRGSRPPLAGLIGYGLLERFTVRLAYEDGTLTLISHSDFHYDGTGARVPLFFADKIPVVSAAADGIAGKFEIDTGSSTALVLQRAFVDQHGFEVRHPGGLRMKTSGVDGVFETLAARLDRFAIANAEIKRPVAEFPSGGKGGLPVAGVDGSIGYQILRRFVLTFDYARGELWVERSSAFGAKTVEWKSGFQAVKSDGPGFHVVTIMPNSLAAAAGISVGDIITEVDGKPAASVGQAEFSGLMRRPDGTVVHLGIVRDRIPRSVALTLKELLP
jgi:hypothetical protein